MAGFRTVVLQEGGAWPIPFSNNLKLAKKDQICIHFKFLSKKVVQNIKAGLKPIISMKGEENVEVKDNPGDLWSALAKEAFIKVDPFPVNYKGNDITVKTYEQLNSIEGLENILFEFERWFRKQEAFDSKKSE